MKAKFNPIDPQTWPRAQEYHFFEQIVPLGFSLTVELDITILRADLQKRSLRFFPVFVWLTTKMLNKQVEFRVTDVDGVVGYWDVLYPMYPILHEDDKTISMMWTEFDNTFSVFYDRYVKDQQLYGEAHGFFPQPDRLPPPNCYPITQLPWIEFKHFAFHLDPNKPHLPSFGIGKFIETNGKTVMPFSVSVKHSTVDGWHVHKFSEDLQHEMDHPESWID